MKAEQSKLETMFLFQLKAAGHSQFVREYRVSREVVGNKRGVRKRLKEMGLNDYRLDFAWPEIRFGIEIQGGIWKRRTGHNSGAGIQRDCTKAQQCAGMDWLVVPVTGRDVTTGKALEFVEMMLEKRNFQDETTTDDN